MDPIIPINDSWWISGIGLAKTLVDIYNDSKFFTLNDYKLKEDFYNLFMNKFEEFTTRLMNLTDNKYDVIIVKKIRIALNILKKRGLLTFSHFLGAYCEIFYLIDGANKIDRIDIVFNLSRKKITYDLAPKEIIEIFDIIYNNYPHLVPFVSYSGIFGFNTFLYLFFNKLFPVAASINPYTVHRGLFKGLTYTTYHDIIHYRLINNVYEISELNREYVKMKNLYFRILEDKYKFDYDELELIILFLYQYIHESVLRINCYENIRVFDMFVVEALIRIKSIKNQVNEDDVNICIKHEKCSLYLENFIIDKMNEAKNILCRRYPKFFNYLQQYE